MAKTSFMVQASVLLLFVSLAVQVSECRELRLAETIHASKKRLLTFLSAYTKSMDSDQQLVLVVSAAPNQAAVVNNNAAQPPLPPPSSGHVVDNFRPTNPGHSPGAGHSLQLQSTSSAHLVKDARKAVNGDEEVVSEAPSTDAADATLPALLQPPPPTRRPDDFKPTTPGHSPGAGHSIQN